VNIVVNFRRLAGIDPGASTEDDVLEVAEVFLGPLNLRLGTFKR
jgi:hypothetical protein